MRKVRFALQRLMSITEVRKRQGVPLLSLEVKLPQKPFVRAETPQTSRSFSLHRNQRSNSLWLKSPDLYLSKVSGHLCIRASADPAAKLLKNDLKRRRSCSAGRLGSNTISLWATPLSGSLGSTIKVELDTENSVFSERCLLSLHSLGLKGEP